jgi:hypothetical protein
MAPHRFNRLVRDVFKSSLVDPAIVDTFVAALARRGRDQVPRWSRQCAGSYELCSGYGTLHVSAFVHGCWTVTRDGAPLVHVQTGERAFVAWLAGVKATGLIHLSDGFGSRPPISDGLRWNLSLRGQYEP